VSQHINTPQDRHGGGAQFIPRGQVAPRGAQHFRSDLCKGRCDLLLEVIFILWSLSVHKWLDEPSHEKSLEASSPGNSRTMGWAHHGRTSDFCVCRLKTPAL
jgi:hypothetical protein